METINSIWSGRAGLAKTYWGYGFLGSLLWGIPFALVSPGSGLAIMTGLAFCAYLVVLNVGIWRAATRYEGSRVWSVLAKIAVALPPILCVIGVLTILVLPPANHVQNLSAAPPQVSAPTRAPAQTGAPSIQDAAGWTQETSGSTEVGPWLDFVLPGARFCRMADGQIMVVYPPGLKPNAEKANPFCVSTSVPASHQIGPDWNRGTLTPPAASDGEFNPSRAVPVR